MYKIIENVIKEGRYELSDILKKIDTKWFQGELTDEEKTELVRLAQEKAKPEDSYAPLQEQINNLYKTVDNITKELKICKEEITKLKGEEPLPQPEPIEYPEYKQPTGAYDAYHKDDKVTFNSERYVCIAPEGVAVVWSPIDYPAYWQKVEPVV